MFDKVKKIGIIVIMAILFTTFSFSIIDMIVEQPEYNDFCFEEMKPFRPEQRDLECPNFKEASSDEMALCNSGEGYIEYEYDEQGCPISYECNTCRAEYESAGKTHRLIGFIVMGIIGIVAVIAGMYLTAKNEIVEWVYSGILIGGIANIFFGTVIYFRDMGRFVKPFILLIEMGLIIWVAIRTSKNIVNKKE